MYAINVNKKIIIKTKTNSLVLENKILINFRPEIVLYNCIKYMYYSMLLIFWLVKTYIVY